MQGEDFPHRNRTKAHHVDLGDSWPQVERLQESLGTESPTLAVKFALAYMQRDLARMLSPFDAPPGDDRLVVSDEGVRYAWQLPSGHRRSETWKGHRPLNQPREAPDRVFIGHGRSPLWRELKDFLQDRLHLQWDEFNRVPVAGKTVQERLREMLVSAGMAFLVLTAEDEQLDGGMAARQNVIHEAGLLQGRLGFARAIVLLEESCEEFSNIHGLNQIRFPRGRISAVFEEVRQVLEREGLLPANSAR